jgi:hypothetical protein
MGAPPAEPYASGPPALRHRHVTRDNDNCPGTGQQSVTCTDGPVPPPVFPA